MWKYKANLSPLAVVLITATDLELFTMTDYIDSIIDYRLIKLPNDWFTETLLIWWITNIAVYSMSPCDVSCIQIKASQKREGFSSTYFVNVFLKKQTNEQTNNPTVTFPISNLHLALSLGANNMNS